MKDLVLLQLHDQAGHLDIHRTVELVKERFYWPGYESDLENWVHKGQLCQQQNPSQPLPPAPLGTIQATRPFEKLSWDSITSKGKKYILFVTDLFSEWVGAFPFRSTDAMTLATAACE